MRFCSPPAAPSSIASPLRWKKRSVTWPALDYPKRVYVCSAPAELSEGQRFRYRLAQFFASDADILIADEFAATLDRVTARVVAHQLGKFVRARRRAAIVATTHEDLAEDLRPALRIWKGFGDLVVIRAGSPHCDAGFQVRTPISQ